MELNRTFALQQTNVSAEITKISRKLENLALRVAFNHYNYQESDKSSISEGTTPSKLI